MVLIWLTSRWWLNPKIKQHGLNAYVSEVGSSASSRLHLNMGPELCSIVIFIPARELNLAPHVPKFIEICLLFGRSYTLRTLPQLRTASMKLFRWKYRFTRIDGKPVFYSSSYKKGVIKIHHLLSESRNFLSRSEFQQKYMYGLSVQ